MDSLTFQLSVPVDRLQLVVFEGRSVVPGVLLTSGILASSFVLEKNEHQSQRKLLMPPFHGERMRSYGKLICDITEKVMEKLTPNQVFLARTTMQDISLQVILQVVFGLYEGERYQELKQLLGKMMELFQSTIGNSFLFFPFLQQNLGKWTPWG